MSSDDDAERAALRRQADSPQCPHEPPDVVPTPLKLASRYPGKCRVCSAEHDIGNWVWWVPGVKGVMCLKCNEGGAG